MATVKISNLPVIDATGLTINDVFAQVDSGSSTTSKVTYKDLFQNTDLIADKSTGNKHNLFLSAGSSFNSPTVGAEFRGTSYNSVIAAGNGVINNSRDSMIVASQEAAGSNFVRIENAGSSFMAATFRAKITGGEQSAIIASQDSDVNGYNAAVVGTTGSVDVNNGPVIVAGSQSGTINGNRVCHIGSEGGTINSNTAGMINSYACTIDGNLYNSCLATYVGTIDNLGGAMENAVHIGTRDSDIEHMRAQMIGTSGRTSQYSATTHAEHLYSFGQVTNGHYDNGSGSTFTIDFDEGNTQELYMTANTSLTFNNVRNGATYKLKVTNGGTYNISSVSASGYTILCEGGSIPNITNNGTDLCVLEVVGTDIMVRHFSDFSEPA